MERYCGTNKKINNRSINWMPKPAIRAIGDEFPFVAFAEALKLRIPNVNRAQIISPAAKT